MGKVRITDKLSMIASVVEQANQEKLDNDVRSRIDVKAAIDAIIELATKEAEKGERSITFNFTLVPNKLAEIVTEENCGEVDDIVTQALSEEIDLNVRCSIDPANIDQSTLTLYW